MNSNINSEEINIKLINYTEQINDIGLMHGKMGMCIYFYLLGKKTGNRKYTKKADLLIDDVYKNISSQTLINFENGLVGIGIGIEFLSQNNLLKANTDVVLSEIDIQLLKHLTTEIKLNISIDSGLLGYLIYVIQRIKAKRNGKNSLCLELNKELLIVLINKLDFHINSSSFRISNDIEFDLFSNFPLLINLLNKAHDLNVHNNKIEHMINQLVSPIETTFPSMSINRLHLACELKHLLNKIPNKRLERHVDILLYSVEFDKLVNELVDNNMGFRRGVTGLIYILDKTNQIIAGNIVLKANVDNVFKQIHVPLINLSDEKVFSNPKSIGITEGYTAALLYNLLDRKII